MAPPMVDNCVSRVLHRGKWDSTLLLLLSAVFGCVGSIRIVSADEVTGLDIAPLAKSSKDNSQMMMCTYTRTQTHTAFVIVFVWPRSIVKCSLEASFKATDAL